MSRATWVERGPRWFQRSDLPGAEVWYSYPRKRWIGYAGDTEVYAGPNQDDAKRTALAAAKLDNDQNKEELEGCPASS